MRPRAGQAARAAAAAALIMATAPATGLAAEKDATAPDASVRVDPRHVSGGDIADHFVGFSVEWSLIDRYMGPSSRHGFAKLLKNLDSGVLRIGGSSQDQVPFDANGPDVERFITPHDLAAIRATLDLANPGGSATPNWVTVLGTAMAPPTTQFPWRSPEHASAFARDGVEPAFGDDAGRRYVAGIALGNEPDLTYGTPNLARYLGEYDAYAGADGIDRFPRVAPNTSENIGPWERFRDRPAGFNLRWFHDWPAILDKVAPSLTDKPGPLGPSTTDHYYPLARVCTTDPYRCASITRLLDDQGTASFDYEVYTHATEAASRGLRYRMDETNTAAGRGKEGVSNVAASATWTLDTLFNAACPQPPDQPGANADCHIGATGLNLHNAEVNNYFAPQEGNAWYNAVRYDPASADGNPTAGPSYYAMLLFARLAQGTTGLRPVALEPTAGEDLPIRAWQVRAGQSERRLFLINKGSSPLTVDVEASESRVELDRMTPHDPTGAGRTLDAPDMRVDDRAVTADGDFPGLDPEIAETHGGRVLVTLVPGEAVVVSLHGHDE